MQNKKPFDFGIFIVILLLLAGGIIMVFSASEDYSLRIFNNSYHFLVRQLLWAGMGIFAMLFVSKIDYRIWGKFSGIILFVSISLLIIVLIPHVGVNKNGAQRWINLGFTDLQPSEIAKLALILFFSYKLSREKDRLKYFMSGLMPYLIWLGVIVGLLLLEPHKSCAVIIIGLGGTLLFTAGARIWHFILISVPVFFLGLHIILSDEYSLKRMVAFMDPWSDPKGVGWQVVNSLYAIGSGGLVGLGLGRSRQKFGYVPEPHNDYIFSIFAEEMGFIGVVTVMLLFLIFIWRGLRIAMHAPDNFSSLLATGITSLVAIQFIINVAVITASAPPTGMPLPFFSYGGSSLMFLMISMGILLNISRYAPNRSG